MKKISIFIALILILGFTVSANAFSETFLMGKGGKIAKIFLITGEKKN